MYIIQSQLTLQITQILPSSFTMVSILEAIFFVINNHNYTIIQFSNTICKHTHKVTEILHLNRTPLNAMTSYPLLSKYLIIKEVTDKQRWFAWLNISLVNLISSNCDVCVCPSHTHITVQQFFQNYLSISTCKQCDDCNINFWNETIFTYRQVMLCRQQKRQCFCNCSPLV